MSPAESLEGTPRQRVERESVRRGKRAFVEGCVRLLTGDDRDSELILVLGGRSARWIVTGERAWPAYWLRVWAARGLLWEWDDAATAAIVAATHDEAWRVREMALKVVAKHRLGEALPNAAARREDPVPRVRAAASRAVVKLVDSGA